MKGNKPTVLQQFRTVAPFYTGKRPVRWGPFAIRFILMWGAIYGFEWLIFGNALFERPYVVLFVVLQ